MQMRQSLPLRSDEALEAVRSEQRGRFRDREAVEGDRIRSQVRDGYRPANSVDWPRLLGGRDPALSLGETGALEAAGAETYVAIGLDEPLPATTRRWSPSWCTIGDAPPDAAWAWQEGELATASG